MHCKNGKVKLLDSKPRVYFFIQTAFGTSFTYLTSGVFLSGLAILMGAGDVLVSYLSIVVNICGVLILAFSTFFERFQSRKRLTIALTALTKLTTFLIVLIPAFVPAKMQLVLLVSIVIVAFTLQSQATVVLNQWMLGFIDETKSGRYISLRQTLTLAVTVLLSITSGYWMDFMHGKYAGFLVLFVVATLMGGCELILLARIPDGTTRQAVNQGCRFRDIITLPLKNQSFTKFVIYVMMFYLLLNVSDSFSMVYLMKYLALPYQTVTMLYMLISLPQVVLLGIWGRMSDKYGIWFQRREFCFYKSFIYIRSEREAGLAMSKIDLHIHTSISKDGEYSPQDIVAECREQGMELIAITDHNSVRGVGEALDAAGGLSVLPGVELDCTYQDKNFHLLGYGIDYTRKEFASVEKAILQQEKAAAVKKIRLFQKATGIPVDEEEILTVSGDGIVTGELIAEVLLAQETAQEYEVLRPYLPGGAKSDMPNVRFYWDFFSEGKPAYVPVHYLSLPDAIKLIHCAGGIAVIAHPGQNIGQDNTLLDRIISEGIDGIEVFSSYHRNADTDSYLKIARKANLLVTCGSDFHGKHKPQIKLGGHGATLTDRDLIAGIQRCLFERA